MSTPQKYPLTKVCQKIKYRLRFTRSLVHVRVLTLAGYGTLNIFESNYFLVYFPVDFK